MWLLSTMNINKNSALAPRTRDLWAGFMFSRVCRKPLVTIVLRNLWAAYDLFEVSAWLSPTSANILIQFGLILLTTGAISIFDDRLSNLGTENKYLKLPWASCSARWPSSGKLFLASNQVRLDPVRGKTFNCLFSPDSGVSPSSQACSGLIMLDERKCLFSLLAGMKVLYALFFITIVFIKSLRLWPSTSILGAAWDQARLFLLGVNPLLNYTFRLNIATSWKHPSQPTYDIWHPVEGASLVLGSGAWLSAWGRSSVVVDKAERAGKLHVYFSFWRERSCSHQEETVTKVLERH